jgi:hypothetical protein
MFGSVHTTGCCYTFDDGTLLFAWPRTSSALVIDHDPRRIAGIEAIDTLVTSLNLHDATLPSSNEPFSHFDSLTVHPPPRTHDYSMMIWSRTVVPSFSLAVDGSAPCQVGISYMPSAC